MSNEFAYQPNDLDTDIFLSEVPISLMKQNILTQFQYPLEYRKNDYISNFISVYKSSKEDLEDEDDLNDILQIRDEFYGFMLNVFKTYLNVGIVDFDDRSEDDQDELIHFTYRFFIMNIKKNFTNLVINYIEQHRNALVNSSLRKKDVTSLSLKKEISDPDDITILANLSDIIDIISHEEMLVDEFLTLCDSCDNNLELEFINNGYDNVDITGNFVEKYKSMVDSDFKTEIESKIRNKILKKYKKKN